MDVLSYIINRALVLIPVLNILGMILKTLEKIPDKFIPLILLAAGILGSIALMGVSADSVIQGVLVTGAAVYGNQVVKQLKKDN
ncbi:MAG: phage holin family protein [Ruminococcus sp.]|nr:phage holin family protein [Ruminococcus sp.]MDY3895812.1 phage holin family protein [Candidatus Fimenecus sp.]